MESFVIDHFDISPEKLHPLATQFGVDIESAKRIREEIAQSMAPVYKYPSREARINAKRERTSARRSISQGSHSNNITKQQGKTSFTPLNRG